MAAYYFYYFILITHMVIFVLIWYCLYNSRVLSKKFTYYKYPFSCGISFKLPRANKIALEKRSPWFGILEAHELV